MTSTSFRHQGDRGLRIENYRRLVDLIRVLPPLLKGGVCFVYRLMSREGRSAELGAIERSECREKTPIHRRTGRGVRGGS